jgi:hypothetical protein
MEQVTPNNPPIDQTNADAQMVLANPDHFLAGLTEEEY